MKTPITGIVFDLPATSAMGAHRAATEGSGWKLLLFK